MSATAQLMYAFTPNVPPSAPSRLVSFKGSAPNVILSDVLVTGLNAGEDLKSIDIRPATGVLYGITSSNSNNAARVVTLNPQTGVATAVGASASTLTASSYFGMSFNPVTDQIRAVTTGTNLNQRFVPSTGALAGSDSNIAYAAGDVNAGFLPLLSSIAHSNSVAGATTTTLYGIDTRRGQSVLVRIGSANDPAAGNLGQLTTIATLSIIPTVAVGGFDIQAGTDTAYATFSVNSTSSNLYRINLFTGVTTLIGLIGNGLLVDGLAVSAAVNPCLDLDGDGLVLPTTDGLMLSRALMGMRGTAVTTGALPTPAPPRATWATIQPYMNANCGMNFAP